MLVQVCNLFCVACLFVLYYGNKPSKMYLIKGSLEVKLPTRGTYWKSRGGKSQRRAEKKQEDQRRERVRRKTMQVAKR